MKTLAVSTVLISVIVSVTQAHPLPEAPTRRRIATNAQISAASTGRNSQENRPDPVNGSSRSDENQLPATIWRSKSGKHKQHTTNTDIHNKNNNFGISDKQVRQRDLPHYQRTTQLEANIVGKNERNFEDPLERRTLWGPTSNPLSSVDAHSSSTMTSALKSIDRRELFHSSVENIHKHLIHKPDGVHEPMSGNHEAVKSTSLYNSKSKPYSKVRIAKHISEAVNLPHGDSHHTQYTRIKLRDTNEENSHSPSGETKVTVKPDKLKSDASSRDQGVQLVRIPTEISGETAKKVSSAEDIVNHSGKLNNDVSQPLPTQGEEEEINAAVTDGQEQYYWGTSLANLQSFERDAVVTKGQETTADQEPQSQARFQNFNLLQNPHLEASSTAPLYPLAVSQGSLNGGEENSGNRHLSRYNHRVSHSHRAYTFGTAPRSQNVGSEYLNEDRRSKLSPIGTHHVVAGTTKPVEDTEERKNIPDWKPTGINATINESQTNTENRLGVNTTSHLDRHQRRHKAVTLRTPSVPSETNPHSKSGNKAISQGPVYNVNNFYGPVVITEQGLGSTNLSKINVVHWEKNAGGNDNNNQHNLVSAPVGGTSNQAFSQDHILTNLLNNAGIMSRLPSNGVNNVILVGTNSEPGYKSGVNTNVTGNSRSSDPIYNSGDFENKVPNSIGNNFSGSNWVPDGRGDSEVGNIVFNFESNNPSTMENNFDGSSTLPDGTAYSDGRNHLSSSGSFGINIASPMESNYSSSGMIPDKTEYPASEGSMGKSEGFGSSLSDPRGNNLGSAVYEDGVKSTAYPGIIGNYVPYVTGSNEGVGGIPYVGFGFPGDQGTTASTAAFGSNYKGNGDRSTFNTGEVGTGNRQKDIGNTFNQEDTGRYSAPVSDTGSFDPNSQERIGNFKGQVLFRWFQSVPYVAWPGSSFNMWSSPSGDSARSYVSPVWLPYPSWQNPSFHDWRDYATFRPPGFQTNVGYGGSYHPYNSFYAGSIMPGMFVGQSGLGYGWFDGVILKEPDQPTSGGYPTQIPSVTYKPRRLRPSEAGLIGGVSPSDVIHPKRGGHTGSRRPLYNPQKVAYRPSVSGFSRSSLHSLS